MAQLFTPGLQISADTLVSKRRELSQRGRVLVSVGDSLRADTVVAEADREGELQIVKVADELGVEPTSLQRYMQVSIGDSVNEGNCIAEASGLWGLFRTTVLAPISGVVEFISSSTGHVGIRAPKKIIELRAYIDGVVSRVESERAVVIDARATLVQGIFGVGGEHVGILTMLNVAVDDSITESDIPEGIVGSILVGGHSPTLGALRKAVRNRAVGFVTGSIDDTTLREYVGYDIGVALTGDEPVSMTLIVTEGFGRIPMNQEIVDVLRRVSGERTSINGSTQVRAGALRPEIIAPPSSTEKSSGVSALAGLVEGAPVRLIRVPYFGMRGVVTKLPRELVQIETGAYARVAHVQLDSEQREIVVPRANLEIA